MVIYAVKDSGGGSNILGRGVRHICTKKLVWLSHGTPQSHAEKGSSDKPIPRLYCAAEILQSNQISEQLISKF